MADGVRLAVTLYLPNPAAGGQPCILEALPYRKDDLTSTYRPEYVRLRDDYGYAVARLDLRGTGSSGGRATDEYAEQEQSDLIEVIAWLAARAWCDGAVGMYGTSYSGFNSLQLAAERPPELKAVIAIYATDDRWTDDVHYAGGALRWLDLVDYCHYMTPMNALPPVPAVWGGGWREEWLARIHGHEPWLLTWLAHQRDGPYWRHGSVRPDYARIACPVMLVGGWADGYRNNTFRTMAALGAAGVPISMLVGPWSHASTATSAPGPRIDLLPEMVAWWDRWLRGTDSEKEAQPAARWYVRHSHRPAPDLDSVPGHWRAEPWPSPRSSRLSLQLDARPPYAVKPDVGVDAWISCAGHLPYGQSLDQRHDDADSLAWEWDASGLELAGNAVLLLRVSASAPVAFVSAKLCDLHADGTSTLITRGLLNLTRRRGAAEPLALVPDEVYDVEMELEATAWAFDGGHRLRLSIAGADWPNTAAPPTPLTFTIAAGTLHLPVMDGPSPFPEPVFAAGEECEESAEGVTWRVERDVLARETACVVEHGGSYDTPYGSAGEHYSGRVAVNTRTFTQTADAQVEFRLSFAKGDLGPVDVSAHSTLSVRADDSSYAVDISLACREGDAVIGERRWQRIFPRDLA